MTRAQRLSSRIKRTVVGPMWHGSALAQLLDGVTHERAAARPVPGTHSIWEIVLHVTAWAEIARARVAGQRLGDATPQEDWPPVDSAGADAWSAAVKRLEDAHRELASDIRRFSDEALDANVATLDYTVDVLLNGVVEHGTYHGGQIALLRKGNTGAI